MQVGFYRPGVSFLFNRGWIFHDHRTLFLFPRTEAFGRIADFTVDLFFNLRIDHGRIFLVWGCPHPEFVDGLYPCFRGGNLCFDPGKRKSFLTKNLIIQTAEGDKKFLSLVHAVGHKSAASVSVLFPDLA